MSKYIKWFAVAVFAICVLQSPKEAKAQIIQGNNMTFELGTVVDDNNANVGWQKVWCYIHDRTTGNKKVYSYYLGLNKSINIYRNGNVLYFNANIDEESKLKGMSSWSMYGDSSSPQSTGITIGNDVYVVVGGVGSQTVTFDGVVIWNPANPTPLPTPTNTPTPTPTNTPTPTPMTNIEVSDTGITELFGFTVDVLNIPFQINGYEISLMQILIYSVLASLLIALVFAPGGKD